MAYGGVNQGIPRYGSTHKKGGSQSRLTRNTEGFLHAYCRTYSPPVPSKLECSSLVPNGVVWCP